MRHPLLCSLRGADIRKLRYAFVVCFAFFNEEYLIALVDFIVALRRTKGRGRRTLRSPPSPSSGLHLIHPGNPLRRGISAAAVDRNIGSLYPVQVAYRHFDVSIGCFVFGLKSLAFQKITLGIGSFVFHWCWMDCSFLRLRGVLLWIFVGITADREMAPISLDASPFHQLCRVQKYRKTAFV